jgi:hypothetical protein
MKTLHEFVDGYHARMPQELAPTLKLLLLQSYVEGMVAMMDALAQIKSQPIELHEQFVQTMQIELVILNMRMSNAALDAVRGLAAERDTNEVIRKAAGKSA